MVLEKRFFRDLNDDIRAAVEENLKYKAMSSDIYDKLIEEMRRVGGIGCRYYRAISLGRSALLLVDNSGLLQ